MCRSHIPRLERVDPEDLRAMRGGPMRRMLLGPPLTQRDHAPVAAELDASLEAVIEFLPQVYGDTDPRKQATVELRRILELPATRAGVICKRAVLLFAIAREPELAEFFAEHGDDGYALDLRDRVLPFVTPRFLRYSCQAPDSYAAIATVLAEMWGGETLGNWPLRAKAGSSDAPPPFHSAAGPSTR